MTDRRRVWAEIDTETGETVRPRGPDLLGHVLRLDGEDWTIVNTDALFPTDRVVVENGAGELRSLSVEQARAYLAEQAQRGGEGENGRAEATAGR